MQQKKRALTAHERDIADKHVAGWTKVDIAYELGMKPGTVENVLRTIYQKAGAKNRLQLYYCLQEN